MTVAELIEKLKTMPQDAEVRLKQCEYLESVTADEDNNWVYLGDDDEA